MKTVICLGDVFGRLLLHTDTDIVDIVIHIS